MHEQPEAVRRWERLLRRRPRRPIPSLTGSQYDCGCNIEHTGAIEKWGRLYPQYVNSLDVFWCPSRRTGKRYAMDPRP